MPDREIELVDTRAAARSGERRLLLVARDLESHNHIRAGDSSRPDRVGMHQRVLQPARRLIGQ